MSKTDLIFLLVTLLAVITTPAAAAALDKRWQQTNCCPISICIFQNNQKFPQQTNVNGQNTFDGFIQFTQTFGGQAYITGFLDIENPPAHSEQTAEQQGFDVTVVDCNQVNQNNALEDGTPNLSHTVDDIFDTPFIQVQQSLNVNQIVGKCCVVAQDENQNDNQNQNQNDNQNQNQNDNQNQHHQHKLLGVAKVQQAVKCNPNQIVINSDPN